MWHKRLLSAEVDRREWYWSNPDTGEVALETQWLVDPIVEIAKANFNQFDERAGWKGDMHHVGFIPHQVIEHEWRTNRKNMLTDKEYVAHWLDMPENRAFRTRPGKLSR